MLARAYHLDLLFFSYEYLKFFTSDDSNNSVISRDGIPFCVIDDIFLFRSYILICRRRMFAIDYYQIDRLMFAYMPETMRVS